MSELSHIKAVVFDAYGTLFDVVTINERLEHYFGAKAAEVGAVWRRKQLEYTWLRTLMNRYKDFEGLTRDALLYACEELMLTIDTKMMDDLMKHYQRLQTYPEVKDSLHRLHRFYELAILSNANELLLDRAVLHNEIGPYLKAIFSVDQLGKYKPVPEVYQLPSAGLGLEKSALLFVSSNTWDVAGAKSAGLQVVWVKRKTGVMEQLEVAPDLIIRNLDELAEHLVAIQKKA